MVSCRCTMWRLVELFCGEIFSVTAVSTGQKGSISAVSFAPRSTALFTMSSWRPGLFSKSVDEDMLMISSVAVLLWLLFNSFP